jgi:iron complex transport system substrate-binding protein
VRVVSLLPSATKIVCPSAPAANWWASPMSATTPPRWPGGTSGELDRSVRELLRTGLAIYDLDLLAARRPDLVVTQALCQVCAVSYDAVCAAVDRLAGREVAVVSLHPSGWTTSLATSTSFVAAVAARPPARHCWSTEGTAGAGRPPGRRGRRPAAGGQHRVTGPGHARRHLHAGADLRRRRHAPGGDGQGAGTHPGPAALERLEPEVVVVKPCGYPVEQT